MQDFSNIPLHKILSITLIFLLIPVLPAFAQEDVKDFSLLWQKLDEAVSKDKVKDAEEIARQIYRLADTPTECPHRLKAFLYLMHFKKYREKIDTDTYAARIREEANACPSPGRNVFYNALAKIYKEWGHSNPVSYFDETDNAVDYADSAAFYFKKSVTENRELLMQTPVQDWEIVLDTALLATEYLTTLYDVLAFDAAYFFKNYKKNKQKALWEDERWFWPAHRFTASDTAGMPYSLVIFRDMLRRHRDRSEHASALYTDLARLDIAYELSKHPLADSLYAGALETVLATYPRNGAMRFAYHRLASFLFEKGLALYKPPTAPQKRMTRRAGQVAAEGVKMFPEDKLLAELLQTIRKPEISLTTLANYYPGEPLLVQLRYRNMDDIRMRIRRTTTRQHCRLIRKYGQGNIPRSEIERMKTVRTITVRLPARDDYQYNSVERIWDGLPAGTYIAEGSDSQDSVLVMNYFQVMPFAYAIEKVNDRPATLRLFDRMTGRPQADLRVKVRNWKTFDCRTGSLQAKGKTDKAGTVGMRKYVIFTYPDYLLKVRDPQGRKYTYRLHADIYALPQAAEENPADFVFATTDRPTYRPGDTVRYKIIVYRSVNNGHRVVPGKGLYVDVYDEEDNYLLETETVTDEFGAAYGYFVLPYNALTGEYIIDIYAVDEDKTGAEETFLVEEYKTPAFETKILPLDRHYEIGDTVEVKGVARGLAGYPLADTRVTVSVQRRKTDEDFINYEENDKTDIVFADTLRTDRDGIYRFRFPALPRPASAQDSTAEYLFTVNATVTDSNGESRSARETFTLDYGKFILKARTEEIYRQGDTVRLSVSAKDRVRISFPVETEVRIYRLKSPRRVTASRPWWPPSLQDIPKDTFIKKLPYIPYDEYEMSPELYPPDTVVWQGRFRAADTVVRIPSAGWQPGIYKALVEGRHRRWYRFKDLFFETEDAEGLRIPAEKYMHVSGLKKRYRAGDTIDFTIGSSGKNHHIYVSLTDGDTLLYDNHFDSKAVMHRIRIPLDSAWETKTLLLHYAVAGSQDLQKAQKEIYVENPDRELQVKFMSFRNRIIPGEKEKWSFRFTTHDNRPVRAQVMAGMYDDALSVLFPRLYFKPEIKLYDNTHINYIFDTGDAFGVKRNGTYPGIITSRWYRVHLWYRSLLNLPGTEEQRVRIRGRSTSKLKAALSGGIFGYRMVVDESELENVIFGQVAGAQASDEMQEVVIEHNGLSLHTLSNETVTISATRRLGNGERSIPPPATGLMPLSQVHVRKDFRKTTFFYPALRTDSSGTVHIPFTVPGSLTRWRFYLLAHTPRMHNRSVEAEVYARKDFMLFPQTPRYVYEGDTLVFRTKIVNLSDKETAGEINLALTNPETGESLHNRMIINDSTVKSFRVPPGKSGMAEWKLAVPYGIKFWQYKIIARSAGVADGEQNMVPVLPRRQLVTESMALWTTANQSRRFEQKKWLNLPEDARPYRVVLELTAQPVWEAVASLPFLTEFPYECAEQTFARYYANLLGFEMVRRNPTLQSLLKQWEKDSLHVRMNPWEGNRQIKQIVWENSPWFTEAQSEAERRKKMLVFIDSLRMEIILSVLEGRLEELQLPGGGYPWFAGDDEPDPFITQHILAGYGYLKQAGLDSYYWDRLTVKRIRKYVDKVSVKDFEEWKKEVRRLRDSSLWDTYRPAPLEIHRLYARSFFNDTDKPSAARKAYAYWMRQAARHAFSYDPYTRALLAIVLYRDGQIEKAQEILDAFEQTAIQDDKGVRWKENPGGWKWYEQPLETHVKILEAFTEIQPRSPLIDGMRAWLLQHKRAHAWPTTKQTTEAVHALLMNNRKGIDIVRPVEMKAGTEHITVEPGSVYFTREWKEDGAEPALARVRITNPNPYPIYGTWHGQYFRAADSIEAAENDISLKRRFYVKRLKENDEKWIPLTGNMPLYPGDLVRVRLEWHMPRDAEYIHVKSPRLPAAEPVDHKSGYRNLKGVTYYESIRDASRDFFFRRMPAGNYGISYEIRIQHAGTFSVGPAVLRSMYDLRIEARSRGRRLSVLPGR